MKKPQPNSRHCFVCGLENPRGLKLHFFESAPGQVEVEYTVSEEYQGYPGVVHGGIVAAMLDEVLGRAHMGVDPENSRFMYTARLEIRYRRNVPVGVPLRIVGTAERCKSRSATSRAAIYGPDDEVLAEAEALLVDAPDDFLDSVDRQRLGWKIYNS